MKLIKIN